MSAGDILKSNSAGGWHHRYEVDADYGVLDEDAHWRKLANTIEPSLCSGPVTLCQITLITCYVLLCSCGKMLKSQRSTLATVCTIRRQPVVLLNYFFFNTLTCQ